MRYLILLLLYTGAWAQAIPKDKQLHFAAGVLISAPFKDEGVALTAGLIAATTKELYDQARYKGFDSQDLAFTVLGTIVEIKTRPLRRKLIKKLKKKRHERQLSNRRRKRSSRTLEQQR